MRKLFLALALFSLGASDALAAGAPLVSLGEAVEASKICDVALAPGELDVVELHRQGWLDGASSNSNRSFPKGSRVFAKGGAILIVVGSGEVPEPFCVVAGQLSSGRRRDLEDPLVESTPDPFVIEKNERALQIVSGNKIISLSSNDLKQSQPRVQADDGGFMIMTVLMSPETAGEISQLIDTIKRKGVEK